VSAWTLAALAALWPAAYWVGRRDENNINEVAEWVSGCAAAVWCWP